MSAPTPFKPTAAAAGGSPGDVYLGFTVTVVNNTGSKYDPTMFNASVQSGDKEAEEVFDFGGEYKGPPSTAVLNGRQSSFKVGFAVSDPGDIVMEVRPGFDYDSAYFTS